VCACAQFNRGDQVDQLAEAGSLGWMLGWSVALLRVSTSSSVTFLSHYRRRPAALFRSFHHPFDREVGPPPSVGRLYPTRTLPCAFAPSSTLSLFLPLSLALFASFPFSLLSLPTLAAAAAAAIASNSSSSNSSSSQRYQLSSTPPATPNCSRVSNRGASRVTLQVADRFAAMKSDCFSSVELWSLDQKLCRIFKIMYTKGIANVLKNTWGENHAFYFYNTAQKIWYNLVL